MKTIAVLLIVMMSVSGCATVFIGTKQEIALNVQPTDAVVQVDGQMLDEGQPLKLKRKGENHTVTVSKEGYIPQTIEFKRHYADKSWISCISLLFGVVGILPAAIDYFTGAIYQLDPKTVEVSLEEQK